MAWVAVAIGGAAVVGAIASDRASQDAARSQKEASNSANDTQMGMYQTTRQDNEPWRLAGAKALTGMENADFQRDFSMADFTADPGYQYRLNEGNKAINSAAAARGMGNSGATMKALAKYGQDQASSEYQNVYNRFNNDRTTRFNRLASLSGVGQTANAQVGSAGANAANQMGQNTLGAGNAAAAGSIAQGNAFNGALGTGMNSWMKYQMNKPSTAPQDVPKTSQAGDSYADFSNIS